MTEDHAKAWRNLMVAAINARIERGFPLDGKPGYIKIDTQVLGKRTLAMFLTEEDYLTDANGNFAPLTDDYAPDIKTYVTVLWQPHLRRDGRLKAKRRPWRARAQGWLSYKPLRLFGIDVPHCRRLQGELIADNATTILLAGMMISDGVLQFQEGHVPENTKRKMIRQVPFPQFRNLRRGMYLIGDG